MTTHSHSRFSARLSATGLAGLVLTMGVALGGCASAPEARDSRADQPQAAAAWLPPTQVYFYPNAGQSPAQQDRDRFECYLWARQQTGFDPSQPQYAPQTRVEVLPRPAPGHDTAVGAVSGAVLGAAVAGPRDAGSGAVVGALAGAVLGAASDAERQQQADRIEEQRYNRADTARLATLERRAADYRRAMGACLEGRGYTVQ